MIQQKLTKGMNLVPKGLGYCAHAEKLGRKMKGKDGNKWIIIENKKMDKIIKFILKKKNYILKKIIY